MLKGKRGVKGIQGNPGQKGLRGDPVSLFVCLLTCLRQITLDRKGQRSRCPFLCHSKSKYADILFCMADTCLGQGLFKVSLNNSFLGGKWLHPL